MLGKLVFSKNLDQKSTAAVSYYRVLIVNVENEFETLLLTHNELTRVRDRVKKNPEDEIIPSRADRMISSLRKLFRTTQRLK